MRIFLMLCLNVIEVLMFLGANFWCVITSISNAVSISFQQIKLYSYSFQCGYFGGDFIFHLHFAIVYIAVLISVINEFLMLNLRNIFITLHYFAPHT